jgi:excisionase family DNA binding protein
MSPIGRVSTVYLMSVEELAEYLGESKRTIYRYIQSGDCPRYIRLTARNIKFDKRDVDAWLESRKVDPKEARQTR